jgi:DNA-binding XRE family transcriptional regulator
MLENLVSQGSLVLPAPLRLERLPSVGIHEQIAALRKKKGWSQSDLAAEVSRLEGLKTPLSWQTVQQWENGTSAPKRRRLEFVARALGVRLESLLGEDPDPLHSAAQQTAGAYAVSLSTEELATQFGVLLASVPDDQREAAAVALAGWAKSGGAEHWKRMFLAACQKRQATGT